MRSSSGSLTPFPWIRMLPGIPPTGKRVEIALVVVVQFDGDKMVHEHLQRSVRCSEPDLQPFNGGHACTGHDAAPLTSWRRTAHSRARNSSRARTDGSRPRRDGNTAWTMPLRGCHCGRTWTRRPFESKRIMPQTVHLTRREEADRKEAWREYEISRREIKLVLATLDHPPKGWDADLRSPDYLPPPGDSWPPSGRTPDGKLILFPDKKERG